MRRDTAMIILLGMGYTIALTLVIVGCVVDNVYWNLFLLAPYVFTPTMTIFIDKDSMEDKDFWPQFAAFIMALSLVSAFAMPLVFWRNDSNYTDGGLGYGLGATFTLYGFMGGAMYFQFADDPCGG
eukprot:UN13069